MFKQRPICFKCQQPVDFIIRTFDDKYFVECHKQKAAFNFDPKAHRSKLRALEILQLTRAFEAEQ